MKCWTISSYSLFLTLRHYLSDTKSGICDTTVCLHKLVIRKAAPLIHKTSSIEQAIAILELNIPPLRRMKPRDKDITDVQLKFAELVTWLFSLSPILGTNAQNEWEEEQNTPLSNTTPQNPKSKIVLQKQGMALKGRITNKASSNRCSAQGPAVPQVSKQEDMTSWPCQWVAAVPSSLTKTQRTWSQFGLIQPYVSKNHRQKAMQFCFLCYKMEVVHLLLLVPSATNTSTSANLTSYHHSAAFCRLTSHKSSSAYQTYVVQHCHKLESRALQVKPITSLSLWRDFTLGNKTLVTWILD